MTASLAVVVPVLDEAAVLRELVARLRAAATAVSPAPRVLLVDDASTDATPELARELSDDVVGFLRLPRRHGQLGATLAGLAKVRAETCVVLDGDLQDPPEVLPLLVAALAQSPRAGAAFAVKTARDDGAWMSVASRLHAAVLARVALAAPPAGAGSYCAMRRGVVDALLALPAPAGNLAPLVAAACGASVAVPYRKAARYDGRSRVGLAGLVAESFGSWSSALRARAAGRRGAA